MSRSVRTPASRPSRVGHEHRIAGPGPLDRPQAGPEGAARRDRHGLARGDHGQGLGGEGGDARGDGALGEFGHGPSVRGAASGRRWSPSGCGPAWFISAPETFIRNMVHDRVMPCPVRRG